MNANRIQTPEVGKAIQRRSVIINGCVSGPENPNIYIICIILRAAAEAQSQCGSDLHPTTRPVTEDEFLEYQQGQIVGKAGYG